MRNKKPPFEITNSILEKIAEIAELVGHVNATAGLSTNPTLRRTNRIRSIYSSLAIEQNTLSLEQVTAVLNGKRVIAPPKDIAEVKNAYEIYLFINCLVTTTFPIGKDCPDHNATHLWLMDNGYIPSGDKDHEKFREKMIDQFNEEAKNLNDSATELWECYCEFVRQGRRLLG